MNKVLVIGSGGREHAIAWRLKQSPSVSAVFCSPGNGGIAQDVQCVPLATHADIIEFCQKENIALVVVGAEQPLVDGLVDKLEAAGIAAFGPRAAAAQLEGSKGFMKNICKKYGIPTADYGFFTDAAAALEFLKGKTYPIVIKADGLAAGKGVVIAQGKDEAEQTIHDMFSGKIAGGERVVIEEFLEGEEVSFFALTDGTSSIEFGYAQDHKRVGEGDTGPNTGGMGTYAPPPVMNDAIRKVVMLGIIQPTVAAMAKEGAPFKGVLFAGLMLTHTGPKLLEYNVRFGDPETQSLMMRFEGDLYPALLACSKGGLDKVGIKFRKEAAMCVVMAADGYPGEYKKGSEIKGIEKANALPGVKVFHAGTKEEGGKILANGGRVLGVTALGETIAIAQQNAYEAVDAIDWREGFCRRDIGWRALKN